MNTKTNSYILIGLVSVLFLASCASVPSSFNEEAASTDPTSASSYSNETPTSSEEPTTLPDNNIFGSISDTIYLKPGSVNIDGIGDFEYNPEEIKTVRDDLFNNGHFSIFDILIHLDETKQIDMRFHFDEAMNTHVIESINKQKNWWYAAYYDGGWLEKNIFRMDHYPYKERMFIALYQIDEQELQSNYDVFREEVARKQANEGQTIIPVVLINGQRNNLEFNDVVLEAHDLRTDVLQPGTITAMDAIMTLGDQGLISYDLQWYESVGSAGIVKDYFVDRINEDTTFNRCGFVYEAGAEENFLGRGNHIHIPPDNRILNSPEYVQFFWICI